MDIIIGFPVEETDHVVTCGESFVVMVFVLEHAFMKIAAYSNVESPCEASHDVNAVIAWVAHEGMIERIQVGQL